MKSSRACTLLIAAVLGCGTPMASISTAAAAPSDDSAAVTNTAATSPGPQSMAVNSPDADPAAVVACSKFAEALDAASDGYGSYADSLDDRDGSAGQSGAVGRTSLRAAAGAAMDAANTPGLSPDISNPMRAWSMGAAALMFKVGLNFAGDTLDSTVSGVNNNAEAVQKACAAAGTHA